MTNDMIGHNNPPDALDEALAPFGDILSEAENWLDGTEAQMLAVDALIKGVKAAAKAVDAADEAENKPRYDAWKAGKARFKPTQNDLARIVKGLVSVVDMFKRGLAAKKEAARKEAERKAWAATEAARIAAMAADPGDIEAQRAAAQAETDAKAAQQAATAAKSDTVKGLHLTWFHEVTDMSALLKWINKNDRAALEAFATDYARRTVDVPKDGVKAWQDRVAA
jgi:hypothetical protein